MSQYRVSGNDPNYVVMTGWDPVRGSFFGQVWPHPIEESEDDPLFVIGDEEIITDLNWLSSQLLPFGELPLEVLEALQGDRKEHRPFRQAPVLIEHYERALKRGEAFSPRYYIHVDHKLGLQTRYWKRLPVNEPERVKIFQSLLADEGQSPNEVPLQVIDNALSDKSLQVLVHGWGVSKRLTPTVFIEPDYLLVGPVIIIGPEGLSEFQVHQVRKEIVEVSDTVRDEVARIFYEFH